MLEGTVVIDLETINTLRLLILVLTTEEATLNMVAGLIKAVTLHESLPWLSYFCCIHRIDLMDDIAINAT